MVKTTKFIETLKEAGVYTDQLNDIIIEYVADECNVESPYEGVSITKTAIMGAAYENDFNFYFLRYVKKTKVLQWVNFKMEIGDFEVMNLFTGTPIWPKGKAHTELYTDCVDALNDIMFVEDEDLVDA